MQHLQKEPIHCSQHGVLPPEELGSLLCNCILSRAGNTPRTVTTQAYFPGEMNNVGDEDLLAAVHFPVQGHCAVFSSLGFMPTALVLLPVRRCISVSTMVYVFISWGFGNRGVVLAGSLRTFRKEENKKCFLNCAIKIFFTLQDGFPIRIKAVNIINEPRIFKGIFAIIKPFLKEKIANRVRICVILTLMLMFVSSLLSPCK